MSEPLATEDATIRPLTKEEMNAAKRTHRTRLGKAMSRNPNIRLMITRDVWDQAPGSDTAEFPKANPQWKHYFSRSTHELKIISEFLGEPGHNSDTLTFYLPENNPGITFTKVFKGKVVESPSGTSDILLSAEAVTSRIEQQFGSRRQAPK